MPPPEPQIQVATPELSPFEKITFVTANALSIGREKGKLSPHTNGRTLSTIADQLRLSSVVPKPDEILARMNISLPSALPARRKAEVVTALAAGTLLHEKGDPGNLEAAALLLTTNYPIQAELQSVMDRAQRQDNGEGRRADLQIIAERTGHVLHRQVVGGNVDRLLATTISEFTAARGLTPQAAAELARAIAKNETPSTIQTAALVPEVRIVYSVARALRNAQSRVGLTDPKLDLPFAPFSRVALQALEQAHRLRTPLERHKLLSQLVENGKIPDRIESLGEILRIVDENPEIRAVSFDLYDTLVQWTEDFADRYGRYPNRALSAFKAVGISLTEDQLRPINERVWYESWANFQSHGTEVPLSDTINNLIDQVTAGKSLQVKDRQKLHHLLTSQWYKLELENAVAMPGARETLDQLKARGIKVILTSNASWSQRHVQRVLNRFGLLEYFDAISISSDIGKMKKPNIPDFFHHSWDKLGIPYQNILHVGDNPNDDVLGARNAGARSTHYHNPLAYNRLEIDKVHGGIKFIREANRQLYAETVVAMQRQSLEATTDSWVAAQMEKKGIPQVERERVAKLAKEVYHRSRDVFAPLYINLSDQLLQQLNTGHADIVLAIARDGLAQAILMKSMLRLDPDRYPQVRSNQIHFIHASRALLKRVTSPTSLQDHALQEAYKGYLHQKEDFRGKRIIITDNVTSGNTYNLLTGILKELGASKTQGLYLDMWKNANAEIHSFLQQSLGVDENVLGVDAPLVQMEALLHGPRDSVKQIDPINTKYGTSFQPKSEKKTLPSEVLSRGLSQESILFMNDVGVRGLLDAVKIRHRTRLAGIPDLKNEVVAKNFVQYLYNTPLDDLLMSVPIFESGRWYLPSQYPFILGPLKERQAIKANI